ncbi:cytoplasmic protein [Klebsiella spallanzanii]|uniref:DUF6630 family protein n=1 Tax=Klebsiella spallanzanii TaxID=2587528 RepID=UPI00115BD10E|nr:cytoplasmic protein [Klebsiella spallanzanii]VUS51872.1 hypothetical protein SB6419_03357 [Klebsiella spallanzanii]
MEEYEVIWDEGEAKELYELASIFLKERQNIWNALLTRIKKDPASFEDEDTDEYDITEILQDECGDLTHGKLRDIFIRFLNGEGLVEYVDWKGEDEEGQLANFAAERYSSLTNGDNEAQQLKSHLLQITQYVEIEKVWQKGSSYTEEVFWRIQQELNARGFTMASLNDGSDTYNIFVLSTADYNKIADEFTCKHLDISVQDFFG